MLLWFRSVVALLRKVFINFWKPRSGWAFQTSQNCRLFSWNDINWNKMQPLFLAALVLAHWIPRFSDSHLNSMKLYHEDFHSALNLPMKSNLVRVLQRCKSKPIIFLLIAECRQGFRSTKVPVQKSRKHNQSEDCVWKDAQYFGSEGSAYTWFYKCNFLDAKAVQVV